MLLGTLLAFVSCASTGPSMAVSLSESVTRERITTTLVMGQNTETSTSDRSRVTWKLEGSIPFKKSDWATFGDSTKLEFSVGPETFGTEQSPHQFKREDRNTWTVTFTEELSGWSGAAKIDDTIWEALKLGTPKAQGWGSRRTLIEGKLQHVNDRLRFSFVSVPRNGYLVAEELCDYEEGNYELLTPIEVKVGDVTAFGAIHSKAKVNVTSSRNSDQKILKVTVDLAGRGAIALKQKS